MHPDFSFTPSAAPAPAPGTTILHRPDRVGRRRAGTALRAWVAAGGADTPSATLTAPLDWLRTHTAPSAATHPNPTLVVDTALPDGAPATGLVFQDRSALVATRTPAGHATVLPVVLEIARKFTSPATGCKYRLALFSPTQGMIPCLRHRDAPNDWMTFDAARRRGGGLRAETDAIAELLRRDIARWAGEIARAPCLADPGTGPRAGILDRDIAAPTPALAGRAYAWPAALAGANYTDAGRRRATAFLELVHTHLLARHGAPLRDLQITVDAGIPDQSGAATAVAATFLARRSAAPPTPAAPDLDGRIQADLQRLLDHPAAPAGLARMAAGQERVVNATATLTALAAPQIYARTLQAPLPAHLRLHAEAVLDG